MTVADANANLLAPPQPGGLRPASRPRTVPRELGLLVVIGLAIIGFSIRYPVSFFSLANLHAILRNLAVDGILATGMMLLMIGGVFDLSVGSMTSMVGVIAGWLMKDKGWPIPAAIATGLAAAALGGFLNGVLVARVRVNALIATLATLGIFQGVAILIGGSGIAFLPQGFTRLGRAEWLGVQAPVWLMLALSAVVHYLLRHTRLFRRYYYIGSNRKAAVLSGIPVERMQILAFTLMGLIAGLAGIAFAARVGTAVSNAGAGAELRVITAVILGGASLTGGKGSIGGALVGVAFMALINNILIITQVSSYWQSIVLGVVLVLAVALDSLVNRTQDT
jgi:ribose transport system permease protein